MRVTRIAARAACVVACVVCLSTPAVRGAGGAWPFEVGEALHYKLGWGAFANAADVRVEFVERRDLSGVATVHFRGSLHSVAPLRGLFPVDDIFDSYSDARTLDSKQYEFHLDELREKETRVRRLATTATMRTVAAPRVIVPAGTRDPLGMLYELRAVDWKARAGGEYRAPMYDGNDVFEVRVHLEVSEETVAVDAGNFRATKVEARLYQRGVEVPKTVLTMWFARDERRTPVLLEAEMPYGKVRAELEGK
jgi:hypothetical protein